MPLLISRTSRQRLRLEPELFDRSGRLDLESADRVRRLAEAIAALPDGDPGAAARLAAADRLAAALEEVMHGYLSRGLEDLFVRALASLRERLGGAAVDAFLARFGDEFGLRMEGGDGGGATGPPQPEAGGELLGLLLLFWLLDTNPAVSEVLSDLHQTDLRSEPLYEELISSLREFFRQRPAGEEAGDLVEILLEPVRAEPLSLAGQLRYVHQHWREVERLGAGILRGIDRLEEQHRPRFPPGPGPAEVPAFAGEWTEVRSFTPDRGWMPRLVLLAKNAYVWLGQLSRRFGRPVERLDQIPDEVLERIAEDGFTALWLIGLWERSPASARVKQLSGNPRAAASAYSLQRYRVAAGLGGEEAVERLAARAASRGIRLAADMVPNHMGIDSDWVLEHPDWFIGLDDCPYPNYTFDGPDLSSDPAVGIYLEDHYYDRSDAAVVFKRLDRRSDRARYLYHGNDGTSTPWNDTAQLDFLNPEVREAVTETILQVARRFPVIRFDAAMTLTRAHFQRLWYPPPGEGGAIPSRADNSVSRQRFDAAMPGEFWREVVGRVAAEAPDTLLLAEAFWLTEGYFVRSLGMHRVYNSAFMNMLRDGETDRYRQLIKETIAFDPEILRRYVNFMSNPDERTARDQFGDGDRYFGTCAVMATLPGVPMFAHGQVEGLRERYGMEYRRAFWEEEPELRLVARHQREIVPLLRRRRRFADSEQFRLYDLEETAGGACEQVLAYSNGDSSGRELVVFNNRPAAALGRLRDSAPFLDTDGTLQTETLVEALRLDDGGGRFVRYRDEVGENDYLAPLSEVRRRGLRLTLRPWECRVLTGFRSVADDAEGSLRRLAQRLGDAGVPSLRRALRDQELTPLREGFWRALSAPVATLLLPDDPRELERPADDRLLDALEAGWRDLARAAASWRGESGPDGPVEEGVRSRLLALVTLPVLAERLVASADPGARLTGERVRDLLSREPRLLFGLYGLLCCQLLVRELPAEPGGELALEEWSLAALLAEKLRLTGAAETAAEDLVEAITVAWRLGWGASPRDSGAQPAATTVGEICGDPRGREALGCHPYAGHEWVDREGLDRLLDLRLILEALAWCEVAGEAATGRVEALGGWGTALRRIERLAGEAGYRLDRLESALAGLDERDPEAAAVAGGEPGEEP